jgi:hypothetical protein
MPAPGRIQESEIRAKIFPKLLKKKYLQFIFGENKVLQRGVFVSMAVIPAGRGLTLRFLTCP